MLLVQNNQVRACQEVTGALRLRFRHTLADALVRGGVPPSALVFGDAAAYSAVLEMAAFALTRGNAEMYMAAVSRVVYNLGSNGVHIVGKYPVTRICLLSHRRMGADTAHAQRDAKTEHDVKELLADAEQSAEAAKARAAATTSTQAIRCPKCKTQNDIVRVAQQSRSADEGMTTNCLCVACGQRWKLR